MPPSIPRPSLRALQSTTVRSFSTTASRPTTIIPPESPRYINLALPKQSTENRQPRLKGHLPVPREVFDHRDGSRKITREYLRKTAPLSAAEVAGKAPEDDFQARRREAAANRRENLAAGLRGLHARSERRRYRAFKSRTERLERNRVAAVETPERADVVLTRPSVRLDVANNTAVIPDPNRMERAAEMAARYAARQQLRSDNRKDALVEMYVASKDYIIDEVELRAAIDKEFKEDKFGNGYSYGDRSTMSIWNDQQAPKNVTQLARDTMASESFDNTAAELATKRQRKLAEVLTGGKLPA